MGASSARRSIAGSSRHLALDRRTRTREASGRKPALAPALPAGEIEAEAYRAPYWGDGAGAAGAISAMRLAPVAAHARRAHKSAAAITALAAALVASVAVATAFGAVPIPIDHVAGILLRALGLPLEQAWPLAEETILWQLRLPRAVAAALVGAALAASGTLLQGLFRNPLADPFVLGVSAGAGLAATLAMALLTASTAPVWLRWAGFGPVPLAAAAGGLAAVTVVYAIARRGGRTPTTHLLLAGFAVSTMLGAASTMIVVLADRLLNWRALLSWMVGGVTVSGWSQVRAAAPLIVVALIAAWALARWLDALLLNEEGAAQIGVPIEIAKIATTVIATLLTGAAVALAGLIGFVGLLVPHAVRLLLGPTHRTLLPAAALAGASFLVLADLLARIVLAPTELPVGAITALVGGPTFLWLLHRDADAARRG
jgi:iron complex transport system permease protein